MKVEEFMVGDLVNVKERLLDEYEDLPRGICNLSITDLSEIAKGIMTVEPIPITNEILEENGFRYEKCYSSSIYRLDEYFLVQYENERYRVYWLSEDGDEDVYKIFTYVHELQHILKMCGIEKNIKKLKVV